MSRARCGVGADGRAVLSGSDAQAPAANRKGERVITAADSEFHERDPSVSNWAETIVLVFSVPEAGILGNAYVLARPNLGVASSSIVVTSGIRGHGHELDFSDARVHLPCPESFLDFELDNGLSVTATDAPRDFHFRYADTHGACTFDLRFRGVMAPFDTHDPDENPLLAAGSADSGYGDAWANGHLDIIGHVTGELELRGRRYAVDCYDGMDRSWGPREEHGARAITWLHVTFGEEFGLHLAVTMDLRDGTVVYDQLRFGYVQEHGEVHGIVEARVEAQRIDMVPTRNHIWARDTRGREYEFHGTAVGGYPWYQFIPAYVCFQSLFRYESDGCVGYAEMGDIFGMEWLGDRISSHARLRPDGAIGARP